MIAPLSLSQLAYRCAVDAPESDVYFSNVSTDSRCINVGDLFVALKGEHFDGHDYLSLVAESGACAAVVEVKQSISLPQLVVDNTINALGQLGALNRELFGGKLVAITGSSGKTTVKEMLAAILATQGKVLATRGNLNNHIGVPLTLLRLQAEDQYAVIEMGASAIGEIDYLAQLAQPNVSVVNNVGTAHAGGFGSIENIAKGKGEIYRHLSKDGIAVINRDDIFSSHWLAQTKHVKQLTYSVETIAQTDVWAEEIFLNKIAQARFCLCYQQRRVDISLSLIGRHQVGNALAAAACAIALDIDLKAIKQGLEKVQAVSGRMLIQTNSAGVRVIDDSYNANSVSMKAAVDSLAQMDGLRILVLGAMAELGEFSESLHREVGAYAKQKKIEHLYAIGEPAKDYVQAFGEGAEYFSDQTALVNRCRSHFSEQPIYLIKGSRSAGMEAVVASLMQENTTC